MYYSEQTYSAIWCMGRTRAARRFLNCMGGRTRTRTRTGLTRPNSNCFLKKNIILHYSITVEVISLFIIFRRGIYFCRGQYQLNGV